MSVLYILLWAYILLQLLKIYHSVANASTYCISFFNYKNNYKNKYDLIQMSVLIYQFIPESIKKLRQELIYWGTNTLISSLFLASEFLVQQHSKWRIKKKKGKILTFLGYFVHGQKSLECISVWRNGSSANK